MKIIVLNNQMTRRLITDIIGETMRLSLTHTLINSLSHCLSLLLLSHTHSLFFSLFLSRFFSSLSHTLTILLSLTHTLTISLSSCFIKTTFNFSHLIASLSSNAPRSLRIDRLVDPTQSSIWIQCPLQLIVSISPLLCKDIMIFLIEGNTHLSDLKYRSRFVPCPYK